MPVDQYIVERIIKARKSKSPPIPIRQSKSPPIRELKDIIKFNNDKINEGAIFRLSVNDFTNMCKKKHLRSKMAIPLKTTFKNLTKFCDIVKVVGKHIDLSAETINEQIIAREAKKAPLFKTIRDLPDEIIDKIMYHYDSMISTIFTSLKTFLVSLFNEVEKGRKLIAKIVKSFSYDDKTEIVYGIRMYFKNDKTIPSEQINYFDGFFINGNLSNDNFSKVIKTLIRNIYSHILYLSSKKKTLKIEYFSNSNYMKYFKNTKLPSNIKRHLISFMSEYTPKLDDRLVRYMSNIIDDVIDEKYVFKLSPDDRDKIRTNDKLYENAYYLLMEAIEERNTKEHVGSDEPTPNKNFVVEKENTKNNFTHEECKMWAMMPIFNPRTITPILIDSPLYNLLLCKSYHYDRNLIPRMITSRGFNVIYKVLFIEDDYYDSEYSEYNDESDSDSDSDDT
jgi:hypothetical protein